MFWDALLLLIFVFVGGLVAFITATLLVATIDWIIIARKHCSYVANCKVWLGIIGIKR